jgi:signal peptide peptidase SppA
MEPEIGYFRIMQAIDARPWAITSEALESIIRIVQSPPVDLDAVAAKLGRPLENGGNKVEDRNGVAVMRVEGPLFRYANVLTRVSGATSIEQLSLDFQAALDDPSIRQVVLAINSPGGQVDGVQELADMIREGGQEKPVTAYIDGLGASGAYWLAAAANRIVASEGSQAGSIGVVASLTDNRAAQERQGVKTIEIVSSQSPLKRSDPATDEGRAQLQAMVDEMATLFIERVARFRGVSVEKVQQDFGRGGLLMTRAAIGAGMVDQMEGFESLLKGMDAGPLRARAVYVAAPDAPTVTAAAPASTPFDEGELEDDTDETDLQDGNDCTCPEGEECECDDKEQAASTEDDDLEDDEDEDDKEASVKVSEERQRIAAILTCEEARGREELARALALDTQHTYTLEQAQAVLKAAPKEEPKPPVNPLEQHMAQLPNPTVGTEPGLTETDDSPAAEVKRILAFVPKDRLARSA